MYKCHHGSAQSYLVHELLSGGGRLRLVSDFVSPRLHRWSSAALYCRRPSLSGCSCSCIVEQSAKPRHFRTFDVYCLPPHVSPFLHFIPTLPACTVPARWHCRVGHFYRSCYLLTYFFPSLLTSICRVIVSHDLLFAYSIVTDLQIAFETFCYWAQF